MDNFEGGNILRKVFLIYVLFAVLLISVPALATPGVEWNYFDTKHFRVIYHPEVQEQAYQIGVIAEDVYKDQSKFTGFTPYRKIAVIVSGLEDFANGMAIPRDVMKIWINPLFLSTRVDQDWLKNLVTHELTHILQTEATFGFTYWMQKLTGASTVLGLPPNIFYPLWYLEGAAQYGSTRQGYDQIDRKRQMVFEQHINSDKFYTSAELDWMRSNLAGEALYNFGFGFFDYLMRTYGEKKFLQLQQVHNSLYFLGLDNTIRIVYHKKLSELVAEWKKELRILFPVREQPAAKTIAAKPALSEWKEPIVTPDRSVIFLQIDQNRPEQQIKQWNPSTGLQTVLANQTLYFSRLALSPEGERLLYTAYNLKQQQVHFDLYELNLHTGKSARLTRDERILQGLYFADGYLLVKNEFGKTQLYYRNRDNKMTRLTDHDYNFVINDLALSPDQQWLALNFNYNGKRGIGIMSTETWTYKSVYYPDQGIDWLLGTFIDNQTITMSADRRNHYDLYQLNISTGELTRLTDTREDILQGQLYSTAGKRFWVGQIYGPEGFTIAQGEVANFETVPMEIAEADFAPASKAQPTILASGKYHHLSQLRSDLFMPYFDTAASRVGFSQMVMDPLMELQFLYDVGWNYDMKRPEITLEGIWTGTNPGFGVSAEIAGTHFSATLTQTYDRFPYSVTFRQSFDNEDSFKLDILQAEITRSWIAATPGSTSLEVGYLPNTANRSAGYSIFARHGQMIPLGYNGDSLTWISHLGAAGGSSQIRWGVNGLLWVYPDERFAEAAFVQQVKYQKNLLDLSANFNLLQTGRLYANLSAEAGVFYNNDSFQTGNMFVGGLEMETKVMNLIQVNYTVDAAVNTNADWDVRFGVTSPF